MSETIKRGESAKFSPEQGKYSGVRPFRNWVQTVLPQVYDDALSYQELFYKMLWYINTLIEDVDTVEENVSSLKDAYDSLETYLNNALDGFVTEINNYYDNLDIQAQVNAKFDELVEDGTLSRLIEPLIPDVETDTTLTQEGVPADAQATGTYCLTCYRTLIDSSNYASNLTNADNCSLNVIYNIDSSITEDMISNLPIYSTNMTLITYSGDNNISQQVVYSRDGYTYQRLIGTEDDSEWTRIDCLNCLKYEETIINSSNYTSFPNNANYFENNTVYSINSNVGSDLISNLPVYSTGMTLITLGSNSYKSQVAYTYKNTVYIRYGNSSSYQDWVKVDCGNAVKMYGEHVTSNSYARILTDANNCNLNVIYDILGNVSSSQVANLPVYGTQMTLVTLSGEGYYGYQIAFLYDGRVYARTKDWGDVYYDWMPIISGNLNLFNNSIDYLKNAQTCVFKPVNLNENSYIYLFGDYIANTSQTGNTWCEIMCNKIGCSYTNFTSEMEDTGFISESSTIQSQVESVEDWDKCTLVIIAAGKFDTTDSASEYTEAIQSVIDYIEKNTDSHIIFITPIRSQSYTVDEGKRTACIAQTALKNKCSVINGYDFPIATNNDSEGWYTNLTTDNTIPNSTGKWIYACSVLNALL